MENVAEMLCLKLGLFGGVSMDLVTLFKYTWITIRFSVRVFRVQIQMGPRARIQNPDPDTDTDETCSLKPWSDSEKAF